MPLEFKPSERMTLGVEVELQILDRETRDLTPAAGWILERVRPRGGAQVKPEIFQSMIEISTGIQDDPAGIRADLDTGYRELREVCRQIGVDLAAAGSHPLARYHDRILHPSPRFQELIDRNRWIAQRLMIFGVHVHVGMRDGEQAMSLINGMMAYLPHLLALSASSPFWQGRDTGLASSRITLFEALPTAGHPCVFESWTAFEAFFDAAVAAGAIGSIKDLWWDVRPHPEYGTVEVRVCDALPTLSEMTALVTLTHLLFRWLDARRRAGEILRPPADWVYRENKWRASRWGLEMDVVLDESGRSAPLRRELDQLLPVLEPLCASNAARDGLHEVERMLGGPASHERQRKVYERTGSLEAVADALVEEFWSDRPGD
jgi:carboxylate-amine ligase